MSARVETIQTMNITAGAGGARISKEKYEIVRRAILKVVPRSKEGIAFRELPKRVAEGVLPELFAKEGSVSWYTTIVKLDLEARGLIARMPGVLPQRLRRI